MAKKLEVWWSVQGRVVIEVPDDFDHEEASDEEIDSHIDWVVAFDNITDPAEIEDVYELRENRA